MKRKLNSLEYKVASDNLQTMNLFPGHWWDLEHEVKVEEGGLIWAIFGRSGALACGLCKAGTYWTGSGVHLQTWPKKLG